MKTARKALLLVLCAVMLVAASVLGTLAYFTDSASAVNTFTVGKVDIDLDEKDVDGGTNGRDKENKYHLIPGKTYTKDPTVHVTANSEDSYIFVKIENDIAAIEAAGTKGLIAAQISENGWTKLDDVDNVYYQEYTKTASLKDLVVFEEFTIKGEVGNTDLAAYSEKSIKVTAYAIQKEGFDTVEAAWAAGNFS